MSRRPVPGLPAIRVVAHRALPRVEVPQLEVVWLWAELDCGMCWDPLRGQCRADRAIRSLARGGGPTVYVLDCDGYYPGFNYVFGMAMPELAAAVVFAGRLKGERFAERLAKEIMHEAGHLLGLSHCRDPLCVMYFSSSLADTDRKAAAFCPRCLSALKNLRTYK